MRGICRHERCPESSYNRGLCVRHIKSRVPDRFADRNRYRAKWFGSATEDIDVLAVFNRDGWTCQICFYAVSRYDEWPSPSSPTIDHIVPLSKGGSHTYSNVRLAHHGCNAGKKDREAAMREVGWG